MVSVTMLQMKSEETMADRYEFIRLRIKVLGWEVDIELLETFSAIAIWLVFADMLNLLYTKQHNSIYDVMFSLLPQFSWIIIAGSLAFVHLIAILLDKSGRSSDSIELYQNQISLDCLQLRFTCMWWAWVFNLCMTISIVLGHSYALVWKFMLLFTLASLWSHSRLRKRYKKLSKKKREIAESVNLHTTR